MWTIIAETGEEFLGFIKAVDAIEGGNVSLEEDISIFSSVPGLFSRGAACDAKRHIHYKLMKHERGKMRRQASILTLKALKRVFDAEMAATMAEAERQRASDAGPDYDSGDAGYIGSW